MSRGWQCMTQRSMIRHSQQQAAHAWQAACQGFGKAWAQAASHVHRAHLASADRFQESRAGMDLLSPVAATFTLQYFLASGSNGRSQPASPYTAAA